MRVIISKVHEQLFSGDAESLTVPTTEGVLTILPHHEPLVAILKPGEATVTAGSETKKFTVESGVLEISGNQVTVLV